MKQKIIKLIKNHIIDDEIILQKPKKEEFGHFAIPVFKYAKQQNKNPMEYAKELCNQFECYDELQKQDIVVVLVDDLIVVLHEKVIIVLPFLMLVIIAIKLYTI